MIPAPVTKSAVSPSGVDQLNCNAVDCDRVELDNSVDNSVVPECPPDALPAPLRHDSTDTGGVDTGGLCCEPSAPRLVCQCLPCDSATSTACGPSHVRVLVQEGLGTPGHCCDIYQCVEQCEHSSFYTLLLLLLLFYWFFILVLFV